MIHSWGNHFSKRTPWSLLYFLNYAYSDIWSSRKFWATVYISFVQLVLLSLYIFRGKFVYFTFLNDKIHNYVFFYDCEFHHWKSKSKYTSLKKYTNWEKLTEQNSYIFLSFCARKGEKPQIFRTYVQDQTWLAPGYDPSKAHTLHFQPN